ncbi:hypothetical protein IG631_22650 [Alternaria alternata]|nr:hypothetical protein IG631_22650 [Alternaria alternata]
MNRVRWAGCAERVTHQAGRQAGRQAASVARQIEVPNVAAVQGADERVISSWKRAAAIVSACMYLQVRSTLSPTEALLARTPQDGTQLIRIHRPTP